MTWSDWDRAILALMMWREYRSGGRERMRACGWVAYNRARSSSQPIHRVITDEGQFSSINPPRKNYDPQLDVWPRKPDARFGTAMDLATRILDGTDTDPTQGALYYWNPAQSTVRGWFDRNIAPRDDPENARAGHRFLVKVGEHYFYS